VLFIPRNNFCLLIVLSLRSPSYSSPKDPHRQNPLGAKGKGHPLCARTGQSTWLCMVHVGCPEMMYCRDSDLAGSVWWFGDSQSLACQVVVWMMLVNKLHIWWSIDGRRL